MYTLESNRPLPPPPPPFFSLCFVYTSRNKLFDSHRLHTVYCGKILKRFSAIHRFGYAVERQCKTAVSPLEKVYIRVFREEETKLTTSEDVASHKTKPQAQYNISIFKH